MFVVPNSVFRMQECGQTNSLYSWAIIRVLRDVSCYFRFSLYHSSFLFLFWWNQYCGNKCVYICDQFFFHNFFSRSDRIIVLDMEQENATEKSLHFFDLVVKINASQRTGSEKINLSAQRPIPSNVNLSVSIYNTYIYQYITLLSTLTPFFLSFFHPIGCFRSLFLLE